MGGRIITQGTGATGSLGSIGATALQLTATVYTPGFARGVTVKADAGNGANFVFVGFLGVTAGILAPTTDGFKLSAGDTVTIEIDQANKLYVIGSTTSLAVSWVGA